MKKSTASFVAGMLTVFYPLSVFAVGIHPAFNPNLLIPDSAFSDTKTFGGAAEIQKFLEQKGSVLANTSKEFVLKLHEPDDSFLKEKLGDPSYKLDKPRTAAELIWDVSQSSGLNPQVILVILNKEQGLITSKFGEDRLQRALNFAMGFACPDNQGCDDTVSGFYFQLFGSLNDDDDRYLGAPKSLMKSFTTPNGRGPYKDGKITHVGDTVTFENTLGGFEGVQPKQNVTIGNLATAALYRYTPHVFNGNYNFWRFFTTWFKYSSGTILKSIENNTYYILENGKRRQLPVFVAKTRKISLKYAVNASTTELSAYPIGDIYQPANNMVVSIDNKFYVFAKGIKYPATRLVLAQKKLSALKAIHVSQANGNLFATGPQLLPKDGTVLRVKVNKSLYIVKDGKLKLFSDFTAKQYKARTNAKLVSVEELNLYPRGGYMAPLDGTLVKGKKDRTIYIVSNGTKKPLPHVLFFNLKYKNKDVVILSDAEILSLTTGAYPTPRNNTYFKVTETGELFLFKNGYVHAISQAVAKKKKLKFNYKFPSAMVKGWKVGKPVK
jgi:hypothetical protein